MVNLIVQLIIALLIAGFVLWIWYLIKPLLASIIAEPFMGIVDIMVKVLIGAIVLFWVVIPLIKAVATSVPRLT